MLLCRRRQQADAIARAQFHAHFQIAQQYAWQQTLQHIYAQYTQHYVNTHGPAIGLPAPSTTVPQTPADVSPSAPGLTQQQQAVLFYQQTHLAWMLQQQQHQQLYGIQWPSMTGEQPQPHDPRAQPATTHHDNAADDDNIAPQPAANAPAPNDAAAAVVADGQHAGEEQQQDWLDIFYSTSRLMVLLALVFFYSSPTRLMIVILFVVSYHL